MLYPLHLLSYSLTIRHYHFLFALVVVFRSFCYYFHFPFVRTNNRWKWDEESKQKVFTNYSVEGAGRSSQFNSHSCAAEFSAGRSNAKLAIDSQSRMNDRMSVLLRLLTLK
jgi:hypothetical protein